MFIVPELSLLSSSQSFVGGLADSVNCPNLGSGPAVETQTGISLLSSFLNFLKKIYLFRRESTSQHEDGQRERKTQTTPCAELDAGLDLRTLSYDLSRHQESVAQPTEPPSRPVIADFNLPF